MFTATTAMFLYAVAPVHMGAGSGLGLIDNPIQREVHTHQPMLAGSGLKGALRHAARHRWDADEVVGIFGPDSRDASEFAGALSIGDASLVAFPVRCLKRGFVYATSAQALARAGRLLAIVDSGSSPWAPIADDPARARAATDGMAVDGRLILETFDLDLDTRHAAVGDAAKWLAEKALPAGDAHRFFREKLRADLVVLPDADFGHFVERATVVEPHVRIDDARGTADDGGLFYTENLPPESLLVAPVLASAVRGPKAKLGAAAVLARIAAAGPDGGFDGELLQIGGDATTGRGQVLVRFLAKGDN